MNPRLPGRKHAFNDSIHLRFTTTQLRKRPVPGHCRPERRVVAVRAEGGRKTSFSAGFVIGGVICGVLGFVYAPQISKALLDEQQRLRVPSFLRDRSSRPVTREEVIGRLDELHLALDQLSQDLGEDKKTDAKEAVNSNGPAEPISNQSEETTTAVEPNS